MTEGIKVMEDKASLPCRLAMGAWAALLALFCGCQASVAHERRSPDVRVPRAALNDILHLWSTAGAENFSYPGKDTSRSFDALLWARLRPDGGAPPVRLLSLAARRSNKFCMVQLANNGLVSYCTSDGSKFLSILFDPRGRGALVEVATKAPVIQTFYGVAPSQTHRMFRMCVLKKPGSHVFFVSFSPLWLRLAARRAHHISYNGRNQVLTIRTRKPSSTRLIFSGWPIPSRPNQLALAISGLDCREAFPHLETSLHLRVSPFGLFRGLPYFAESSATQAANPNTRWLGRSKFVARYRDSISATGRISAPAAVGRRRFLNWAVGQKEASVLDDWIYKGIAPVRTVKRTKAGGAE